MKVECAERQWRISCSRYTMNKQKTIKRIGIDARFYGPVGKGLGRYTQEVVDNVIKLDGVNEYVVFLTKENFDSFDCDGQRVKKILADVPWYGWREQLILPWLFRRAKVDLMHFPHFNVPIFYGGKFVVTIHDLILIKYPTVRATTLSWWLYWFKNLAYRVIIWSAVWRAKKIIAVSKFTKNDILRHFRVKADKIIVTYEGVANLSKGRETLFDANNDKDTLLRYNIDKPFLLYVGNAYPHKNLERLFRVFAALRQESVALKLVLVGREDYFYDRLQALALRLGLWSPGAPSPIIFTGYVNDADLESLFRQALAYVFPSLYEGFGLPPLEAMAKGCPVVSSDRSSMKEILGSAALYFNPEDETDIKNKLHLIAGNEPKRKYLRALGYQRFKRYNWWECARLTHEVYQQVLYGKIKI